MVTAVAQAQVALSSFPRCPLIPFDPVENELMPLRRRKLLRQRHIPITTTFIIIIPIKCEGLLAISPLFSPGPSFRKQERGFGSGIPASPNKTIGIAVHL